jgi:hypothetical protein
MNRSLEHTLIGHPDVVPPMRHSNDSNPLPTVNGLRQHQKSINRYLVVGESYPCTPCAQRGHFPPQWILDYLCDGFHILYLLNSMRLYFYFNRHE